MPNNRLLLDLRRWHAGVVIAVLCTLLAGVGTTWRDRPVRAQTVGATTAVVVAPAMAEGARSSQAHGVFYHQTLTVTLPPTTIWLAASPDGQGTLCTDDQATLTFTAENGQTSTWSHLFARADRQAIVCIPPQDLSAHLGAGQYHVEVVLEDLYPHTYSTRPYYLVLAAEAMSPTPATSTALPRNAAAVRPSVQATAPAAAARARQIPAGEQAPASSFPATPTSLAATGRILDPSSLAHPSPDATSGDLTAPRRLSHIVIGALAGGMVIVVGTGIVLARRRRPAPQPSHLTGIIDLMDTETGSVRTALLQQYPRGVAITHRPLAWLRGRPARLKGTRAR